MQSWVPPTSHKILSQRQYVGSGERTFATLSRVDHTLGINAPCNIQPKANLFTGNAVCEMVVLFLFLPMTCNRGTKTWGCSTYPDSFSCCISNTYKSLSRRLWILTSCRILRPGKLVQWRRQEVPEMSVSVQGVRRCFSVPEQGPLTNPGCVASGGQLWHTQGMEDVPAVLATFIREFGWSTICRTRR